MGNRDEQNTGKKEASEPGSDSGLDLGLGLFLTSGIEPQADEASEHKEPVSSEHIAEEVIQQNPVEMNEFERLAQANEWMTLLGASESVLENQQVRTESSQKWIEAQAWWILAQLELKSLPAAVLSAPLEAMFDHLVGTGASVQNSELPDKASELEAEKNLTLVKKATASLVERYFSQAEMVSGMQLASRGRVLGGDLTALVAVVKKYAAQLNSLSGSDQRLYSILCKELAIEAAPNSHGKSAAASVQISTNGFTKESEANDKYKELLARPQKSNSFFFSTIIIFILLLAVAALLFWIWSKPTTAAPFPAQTTKLDIPNPSLQAPKPEPVTKVSELDAVLYGMGNKENGAAITEVKQATQSPSAATPKPKIALDTKGPIESPGLRDLRGQRDRQKAGRDQKPDIIVPGPAIAPRFENFTDPKVYKIVRATNLMLKPSLNSDPVAGLNRGDRVKVVGVAGYWLRVMSRQGRVAFVLAEDTEPSN